MPCARVAQYGGAISNSGSMTYLEIHTSILESNQADTYGGAIFFESGTLIMDSCVLKNNIINDDKGLGLYSGGGNISLRNTTFAADPDLAIPSGALFISGGGVIDYGPCTPGSAPGLRAAAVPVLRDGRTDFTGCPYLCPAGSYADVERVSICVTGRTGVSSKSVTDYVRISILKDRGSSLDDLHNVTLRVEGTDTAATDFAVSMSRDVGWLTLPPQATLAASNEEQVVPVPLRLSASSLMEQAEEYSTTITLRGQSPVTRSQQMAGEQPVPFAFEMPVSLFVSATTYANTTRWGSFDQDQVRTGCADISSPGLLEVRRGRTEKTNFTACDLEALPVYHQLPLFGRRIDPREFAAQLARADSDARRLQEAASMPQADVKYASAGAYDVLVKTTESTLIGLYTLTLALDEEPIAGHVDVRVICPEGLIELADGISCGCEAGQYLLEGGECKPCAAGTYSGEGKQSSCTDCSEGTFSSAGAAACQACPAGTFTPDARTAEKCTPCLPNEYSAQGASVCKPCGKPSGSGAPNMGMDCEGGVLEGTFPNYWASQVITTLNANESKTFGCDPPGVCLGGQESGCVVGHEGPLCSVCSEGYFVTADKVCEPCEVEPLGDGVKAAVLLGALLLGMALGSFVMSGAAHLELSITTALLRATA